MKNLLLCVSVISFSFILIKAPSLSKVRSLYQKTVADKKSCKELIDILAPYNEKNNPLLYGYKASATMLMANFKSNPFKKLSTFKEGKEMLEKAVAADSGNVELRFLRFAAQTNAPSFLKYTKNIPSDKAFLLEKVPELTDSNLIDFIVPALKDSHYLTEVEKQGLE